MWQFFSMQRLESHVLIPKRKSKASTGKTHHPVQVYSKIHVVIMEKSISILILWKRRRKKKKKEWWIKNYLPTNFHLPLKPHVSGAELPVSSCNAENTLKTSSYSQACFQSHKGKIFLIWIPRHSLHYLLFSSRSIFCFISLLIRTVDCTCCSIKILTSAI